MAGRKERVFNCPGCGVEVRTLYATRKFCPECAEKRLKESSKKAQAKLQERRKAEAKKAADEKSDNKLYMHDSQEDIEKCLNCTKPKCNDCLSLLGSSRRVKDDG